MALLELTVTNVALLGIRVGPPKPKLRNFHWSWNPSPNMIISLFQAVAEHEQQKRQQEADNKWENHLLETTDQYIQATRTKRINRYLVGLKALSTHVEEQLI